METSPLIFLVFLNLATYTQTDKQIERNRAWASEKFAYHFSLDLIITRHYLILAFLSRLSNVQFIHFSLFTQSHCLTQPRAADKASAFQKGSAKGKATRINWFAQNGEPKNFEKEEDQS